MNRLTVSLRAGLIAVLAIFAWSSVGIELRAQTSSSPTSFSVMAWNIWHGGREDGEQVGPERVVDVIRDSGVDLVAMQETYGSGELISDALKFQFHPRGTNVSIHSRFPVVEDLSVFEEFKCVGALIELPDKRRVAFYSIWLPYNKEIWVEGTRDTSDSESMLAACQASCDDLKKIKSQIEKRLGDSKYDDVPIVIAGDFNSMSHLDYIPSFSDQYEVSIDWPTSHVLLDDGFVDSWRLLHPEVDRSVDRTWTPRFPEQEQDRIDYVYYRGRGLNAKESLIIDSHQDKFPSDHAALVTRFAWSTHEAAEKEMRVASYNIRHGAGMDNRFDLNRTAALLSNLQADFIGLQEVDCECQRSGGVDQAAFLGERLGMESAFGTFMDFQGGRYGMAILSRHPIEQVHEIRLPDGHEPRVALACEIRLPSQQLVTAVNVHFDWVADDSFRYAQAEALYDFLGELETPYVLLGDFNDVCDSRTLKLLSQKSLALKKPESDRFTFSSQDPQKEIDFIIAAPANRWKQKSCQVLDAPKTSDHRPIVAVVELTDEAKR